MKAKTSKQGSAGKKGGPYKGTRSQNNPNRGSAKIPPGASSGYSSTDEAKKQRTSGPAGNLRVEVSDADASDPDRALRHAAMVHRSPVVLPSQQKEESYQTPAARAQASHKAQIALFQKRMGLLPEFKLSKEQADLSRRPLQLPEKDLTETSQEPGPHEESTDVGGSDDETAMVPPEGDVSVCPKTSGNKMLLLTEPVKKSRKAKKKEKKEARQCKEMEMERYASSATSSPKRPDL